MLKALIFSRFAAMFAGNTRKRRKSSGAGRIILLVFLLLYVFAALFAMMFGLFISMLPALAAQNAQWVIYAIAAIAAAALSLIFDIPMVQSQLYEARDNEFLLSMPIAPWKILFSRMIALYGISLLYSLAFYIPAFVAVLLYVTPSAAGIALFVLAALLSPLLPLAISCLIGRFFAFLKKRFARAKILMTLILGVAMCAYFYLCANLSNYTTALIENAAAVTQWFETYMWPYAVFGRACLGSIIDFALFALLCIAVFGAVYAYLSKSFLRLATARDAKRVRSSKDAQIRMRSVMGTLLVRELQHFSASSVYMLNAGLGLLMQIAAGVFLLLRGSTLTASLLGAGLSTQALCGMLALGSCLLCTMTLISAPSVSLESNRIWIVQSMPVDASKVLMSKVLCHFVLGGPAALISGILFVIAVGAYDICGMLLIASGVLMTAFCAFLGVCMNLVFPRLDFISDVAAVKQSGSTICTMFLGWAIVGLCAAVYMIWLHRFLSVTGALALLCLALAIACAIMYAHLKGRGARKFETLG